jgi:hypothetical protein
METKPRKKLMLEFDDDVFGPSPVQAEACAAELSAPAVEAPKPAPKTPQQMLLEALDAELPTLFRSRHEVGRLLRDLRPFYSKQGRSGGWRPFLRSRSLAVSTANDLIRRYEEESDLRPKRPNSGHFGETGKPGTEIVSGAAGQHDSHDEEETAEDTQEVKLVYTRQEAAEFKAAATALAKAGTYGAENPMQAIYHAVVNAACDLTLITKETTNVPEPTIN